MVPKSGRIKKTSIEIMSKMMQTFTLSYQESNHVGPAFYILFTDFTKFENKKKIECYYDYDDETNEEDKEP